MMLFNGCLTFLTMFIFYEVTNICFNLVKKETFSRINKFLNVENNSKGLIKCKTKNNSCPCFFCLFFVHSSSLGRL